MKNQLLLPFVIVTSTLLGGCATIIKGESQFIPINSNPTHADVIADGTLKGQTPLELKLERKRDHLVTIQKEGHKSISIPIVKNVGGAVWGNILAGGLIGWGVDATSGAQYNLSPTSISVELETTNEPENQEEVDARQAFVLELNQTDQMKEQGQISDTEYLEMRQAIFKRYFPEMTTVEDSDIEGQS